MEHWHVAEVCTMGWDTLYQCSEIVNFKLWSWGSSQLEPNARIPTGLRDTNNHYSVWREGVGP